MKHFLTIVSCLFIITATAQDKNFKEFYRSHKKQAEVSLNVPGFIANLFIDTDGDRELKRLLKKGKNYKVLVFDNNFKRVQKDFKKFIKKNRYKTLVRIKDGDERVTIHFRKNKNRIREIIVNVYSENEDAVLLGLKTNLTQKELNTIISRSSYRMARN
jgi:hypothetical protein